jgi:adenylate cyclase
MKEQTLSPGGTAAMPPVPPGEMAGSAGDTSHFLKRVAERLKRGEVPIVDHLADVSVMFIDLAGFSQLAATLPPADLVELLNQVFSRYDRLAAPNGLEKIKTIGDSYMVVGGLFGQRPDHLEAMADMALQVLNEIERLNRTSDIKLGVRIGLHSGPVTAGIIGKSKFAYDLWGETVNLASRMESHGLPGCIQVTAAVGARLAGKYHLEERGLIDIKGAGRITTYLLYGRR